jgi:organic hydroperoxide reductase OsmC/OhrA
MGMPSSFPHHYEASVTLEDQVHAEGTMWTGDAPRITVGPPPQFDGQPGHHSPEDLLLAAVASCHMTTLVALARRKDLPIKRYEARASGTLDKTKEGLRFTSIGLHVQASTEKGREKDLEPLIRLAETHCIISNALRLEVALHIAITGEG